MAKRIVLLSDGTWNDGEKSKTNIHWLHQNLQHIENEQVVFYDAGVGTDKHDEKIGGATGLGLSRNVRQLYENLLSNYEPGDEVYCFGFSRGAFTVRSLCGFAKLVGRLQSDKDIDDAYTYYRLHEPGEEDNALERFFKQDSAGPIYFRFVGVFDTVGSLGIPVEIDNDTAAPSGRLFSRLKSRATGLIDTIGDRLRKPIKGFHDTSLSSHVEEACHALAIDERRAMFAPTLWTNKPGHAIKFDTQLQEVRVPQVIDQTWFAGVHSNVGGGYDNLSDNDRLSDIPLHWMVEKAAKAGLVFKPNSQKQLADRAEALQNAAQHDSMTDSWKTLQRRLKKEALLRPIGNRARTEVDPSGEQFPAVLSSESIHPSVEARLGETVEVVGPEGNSRSKIEYNPENIPAAMVQTSPA